MLNIKYRLKQRLKLEKFIRFGLILYITLVTSLVASCGCIPGAKECNAVVDSFMQAGAIKDVDAAYALCVEEMAKEDIENLILKQHQFFAGYQSTSMRGISVTYSAGRNFTEYNGEAKFSDGKKMWVEAELIKRNGNWKLVSIHISP